MIQIYIYIYIYIYIHIFYVYLINMLYIYKKSYLTGYIVNRYNMIQIQNTHRYHFDNTLL